MSHTKRRHTIHHGYTVSHGRRTLPSVQNTDAKDYAHYITIGSVLAIPLTYLLAYLLRLGQCYYYGISIDLLPVSTGDFFSLLFPLALAIGPIATTIKHLGTTKWDDILLLLLCVTALWLTRAVLPFNMVLSSELLAFTLTTPYCATCAVSMYHMFTRSTGEQANSFPRTCIIKAKQLGNRLLTAVSFFALLWLYANAQYIPLLICFLFFCLTRLCKNLSTENRSANARHRPKSTSLQFDWTIPFVIGLACLVFTFVGYTQPHTQANYSVLTIEEAKNSPNETASAATWCILCLRSDNTAVCIPAYSESETQYMAYVGNNEPVKIIDATSPSCTIVSQDCKLIKTVS